MEKKKKKTKVAIKSFVNIDIPLTEASKYKQ